jgi:glucokinase
MAHATSGEFCGHEVTLAADLGGTHLRAALVDDDGQILFHESVETPHKGLLPTTLVELMTVAARASERPVQATIVGVPGLVNYDRGALEWAPHIPEGWVTDLSEEWLSERLGRAVTVANDADLAAVGEAYFGAGRPFDDVVYLTVSTGIGAGVLLNRRLVHGHRSIGEVGHTVIDRVAWRAGRPATVEALGSGSSIARLCATVGLAPLDGPQLEEAVAGGDERARQVWNGMIEAVTIGLVNLDRLFSPQAIVIGGGLGSRERLLQPIRELLAASGGTIGSVLLPDELGDNVGLLGAPAWTRAFGFRSTRTEGTPSVS